LELPEQHEQEYHLVIAGVMQWLKEHGCWLLIFDNVEDVQRIYDLLPTAYCGYILLTTRATAVGTGSHRIEVEKMSVGTGALLLLRCHYLSRCSS
jgi:hypothetical protein